MLSLWASSDIADLLCVRPVRLTVRSKTNYRTLCSSRNNRQSRENIKLSMALLLTMQKGLPGKHWTIFVHTKTMPKSYE